MCEVSILDAHGSNECCMISRDLPSSLSWKVALSITFSISCKIVKILAIF
jgi:hypothetical protein